ncbi:hypothetical protein CEXT_266361 [Caerostris extrusa]|uniref:Uncharacterized protein n=1 Tax=Caerostris extrusa TaxID=172846 RepID=A0AAV4QLR5_CAEEX|nr:hypothetical protein CEXT_266361 [Caerostris extrusa]
MEELKERNRYISSTINHRRSADDSSAVINCPEQIMKKRLGKLRNNGLSEYFMGNLWNFSAPKQKFWDCSGRSDGARMGQIKECNRYIFQTINLRRSADDSSAVINCPEQIMKKRFGKLRNSGSSEYFVGNLWNFSALKQKFWDCSGRFDR